MSEKEIIKVGEEEVILPDEAWGASDEITQEDFLVSKILLMQPLSDQVVNGEAKPGEFRDSITQELLGDDSIEFDVLIFNKYMTWVIFENGKYKTTAPVTAENRSDPWQEVMGDGTKIERNKTYNFYCLSASEIASQAAMPRVLSLKRTGWRTGQMMMTLFSKLRAQKKSTASVVLRFKAEKRTNDRGTFFVVQFDVARDSTKEEEAAARIWYLRLKDAETSGNIKVDESEDAQGKSPIAGSAESGLADDDIPF